jgi:hypothetical protein
MTPKKTAMLQHKWFGPEGRYRHASPDRRASGHLMRDADERLTFRRALRAPEFWLLVVASLAAAGGVPWWVVVPLTLAGLSIASFPKYIALWPRARRTGAEREWLLTVSLSMFNKPRDCLRRLPPRYRHPLALELTQ